MLRKWRSNRKAAVIACGMFACLLLIASVAVAGKRRSVAPPGGPQAVAHVNGAPIYKSVLDLKAQNIATNLNLSASSTDVRAQALQHLVKQEILYQAAPRYGIVVTDAELMPMLRQSVEVVLSSSTDANTQQEFLTYLQRAGITPEQYPTNPTVLQVHRRTYAIERMRQWVMDRVPLEKRTSTQALESAVDEFIEQQYATVTYP